mmetsp:Transcript_3171/g.11481  ORF Transcript_3171/g.11481 Transcript_3171/m.11481 type:complete len:241 (+) Transcript_3171:1043-1765(+)
MANGRFSFSKISSCKTMPSSSRSTPSSRVVRFLGSSTIRNSTRFCSRFVRSSRRKGSSSATCLTISPRACAKTCESSSPWIHPTPTLCSAARATRLSSPSAASSGWTAGARKGCKRCRKCSLPRCSTCRTRTTTSTSFRRWSTSTARATPPRASTSPLLINTSASSRRSGFSSSSRRGIFKLASTSSQRLRPPSISCHSRLGSSASSSLRSRPRRSRRSSKSLSQWRAQARARRKWSSCK